MSKIKLTDSQVNKLSTNKWIKNVTNNGITYTDEFKIKVVKECEDFKKFARDVFNECGIDSEVVGMCRIHNSIKRWRKQYKSTGEIVDTRTTNSGRKLERELSESEKLKRAEARIKLLEAENELLKKNEMIELGLLKNIKSISNLKQ